MLGNQRVTFNIPGSSEENTSTDDVDTSSEKNNISVINGDDQENNIPVISEENTTTTTQRPKRSVKPTQRLHPMVAHSETGKTPKKRTTKHLKGKKRNNYVHDNATATILAHVMQHYSSTGE